MDRLRRARCAVIVIAIIIALQAGTLPASAIPQPTESAPLATAVQVPDPAGGSDDLAAAGVYRTADVEAGTVVARDAQSRTVANGDGSLTTTASLRPQHFRDAGGAWRDFDNELRGLAEPSADLAFGNVAGPFDARFAPAAAVSAGKPVASIALADASLTMTAIGAAPQRTDSGEGSLTYIGAWPGADLRYSLDNERIKEEIILAAAPLTAPAFGFALDLDGLRVQQDRGGGLAFLDGSGAMRFIVPPLVMSDTAATPATARVAYRLITDELGRTVVTLTPALEWLADPARVYPVSIDPSIVSADIRPEDDHASNAHIVQATPTTNFYGSATMTVGKNGSGSRTDSLIAFPSLDGFPSDSVVISAELELELPTGTNGMGLELLRIEDDWEDSTVTWNNASAFDTDVEATATAVVGGATEFDIGELVNEWISDTEDNEGVRVRSTGANGQSVAIHSSWATCGDCQPELEVTYVPATRFGFNPLWTQTSAEYGGGNAAAVEISSGNLAFTHSGGAIDARGFSVALTHTYNSADPIGAATGGGAGVYGEGWSFAPNLRLFEVDNPDAVVFKDGSGDESRVFVNDGTGGGLREYRAPAHYGFTLVEDTSSPPADKVWTLTSDVGNLEHYFDAEGKLTGMEDRNGNTLDYAYDGSDRLITITDVAARDTELEYNATGGRLSEITDMAGRVHTYGYNGSGDLTSVTHADGTADEVTTTFAYDDAHRLLSVTNPRGHTANIAYTAFNRWESAGDEEDWQVGNGDPTLTQSTTRAHGGTGSLQVGLTALGDSPESVEKDLGTPEALSAIAEELLVWVFLPSGSSGVQSRLAIEYEDHEQVNGAWQTLTANAWAAVRLPSAQLEAQGQVGEIELQFRRVSGQPTFTGNVWVDDLALRGQVASQSDAKPSPNTVITYAYDPDDAETDISRPNSGGSFQATNYEYDRLGAVTEVTDPLGHVNTYARDGLLRITEVTPPGVGAGTYTMAYYPNSMQLQSATNGADEISRRGADTANGDTRYSIDPLNEERRATGTTAFDATVFIRDATGNVLSAAQSNFAGGTNLETADLTSGTEARQADFSYTTGGLLDTMTDPEGNDTIFDYDIDTGYLTEISAEAGNGEGGSRRITTFTRNADGSVDTMTDAKGQVTSYDYDTLGRLTDITYDDGGAGEFTVSYTLDEVGNLTAMTDAAGSSSWTYDENNRVTAESRTQNATTKNAAYAYFANGTMQTLTTFASQTVTFAYDNALRVTSQTDPKNGGNAIAFGWDDRDRRETITYPSGVTHTQSYDPGGRIAQILLEKSDGTDLQKFTYAYGLDGSGNQTANFRGGNVISVAELSGAAVTYTYDAMFRLTGAVRTVNNTFNQGYAYDNADNRTSFTGGGTSYTYDDANQMITAGATSYTYDRNGNLSGYTGGNTLTYNAANQWTAGNLSGASFAYTYDGLGRQVSTSHNGTRTDLWFDQTGLTLETGGNNRTYLRDQSGLPLSVLNGATLSNFGRDRLGSLTGLTSTTQALSGSFVYQPWGAAVGGTGNSADTNLRFAGSRRDTGTGWFQMGVRTYSYGFARFTQPDPLPSSITDMNRYAYAGCNPTNFIDPTGTQACTPGDLLGRASGAVSTTGLFILGGLLLPTGTGAFVFGFAYGFLGTLGLTQPWAAVLDCFPAPGGGASGSF